ncbi:MAG: pilin N-terminal domain-containing protein [Promicromonosporaceae bacterium]|nr:pilin N-terminal domain-containing protein [Promicromonosporaceae bacterium]
MMFNLVSTLVGAALAFTLPLAGLVGAVPTGSLFGVPAADQEIVETIGTLPPAGATGSLTLTRQTASPVGPALEPVDVRLYRLPADASGNPINLSTRLGWERAAVLAAGDPTDPSVPRILHAQVQTIGGIAVFEEVPVGLYLVVQTYVAGGLPAAAPFVVTMPRPNEGLTSWVYDVEVYSKSGQVDWARLGGVVWHDQNEDGLFDEENEPVKAGVRIRVYTLTPEGLVPFNTTYTGPDGRWLMYGPAGADKVVRVDLDPINNGQTFEFTLYREPAPAGIINSEVYPATAQAQPVGLIAFETVFVNAGVRLAAEGPPPPSPTPTPTPEPSPDPTPDPSPAPTQPGDTVTTPPRPNLPVTGGTLAGLAVATGAVATGLFFRFIAPARRRREEAAAADA